MSTLPMIPQNVRVVLAFNPEMTENETIRQIFSDRIARNLWLGVKWRHLADQFFDDDCLRIADQIKKTPPKTAEELKMIFHHRGKGVIFKSFSDETEKLAEALLPYVRGELDFSHEVIERKT